MIIKKQTVEQTLRFFFSAKLGPAFHLTSRAIKDHRMLYLSRVITIKDLLKALFIRDILAALKFIRPRF